MTWGSLGRGSRCPASSRHAPRRCGSKGTLPPHTERLREHSNTAPHVTLTLRHLNAVLTSDSSEQAVLYPSKKTAHSTPWAQHTHRPHYDIQHVSCLKNARGDHLVRYAEQLTFNPYVKPALWFAFWPWHLL